MTNKAIGNLRVYQLARELEDQVYDLIKALPQEERFLLSDNLRRSSSAVAHFIAEAHGSFAYTDKVKALYKAIDTANETSYFLQQFAAQKYGDTAKLQDGYTGVVKQTWGLIKYLKNKPAKSDQSAQLATAK